jgi:hypothetical protein
MDEGDLAAVPKKVPKVITNDGKEVAGKVLFRERGKTTSVVDAVKAIC